MNVFVNFTLCLVIFVPFKMAACSDTSGIRFVEDLSWEQVKGKARKENKYIFVDCYATWCGPCKAMDRNVYPNKTIGLFLNSKFISVKVQMDTTKRDGDEVKRWYKDAHSLMKRYKVREFPTFLFFSPDGRIVHRSIGYQDTTTFLELANFVVQPQRLQFYSDLEDYRNGRKEYSAMPGLIKTMSELLGDKEGAAEIAKDYKVNYLDKLPDQQLLTGENIKFIFEHLDLISSTYDRLFKLIYSQHERVDSLYRQKGAALYFVNYRIAKDIIWDKLFANDTTTIALLRHPNWDAIYQTISERFATGIAKQIVPESKIMFYRRVKDWRKWAALQDQRIKEHPPKPLKPGDYFLLSDSWNLNVIAWDAFLYCSDKSVLRKALFWSELSIQLEQPQPNVQYMDTKANLLYKLGRVREAISQEKIAVKTANAITQRQGRERSRFADEYSATIWKMENGEPTWPAK